MKLTLHNLGCIREAEIDWRPLTVFVGPNNTNKTWAAYAAWAVGRCQRPMASDPLLISPSLAPLVDRVVQEVLPQIKRHVGTNAKWESKTYHIQELFSEARLEMFGFTLGGELLSDVLKIEPERMAATRVTWEDELAEIGPNFLRLGSLKIVGDLSQEERSRVVIHTLTEWTNIQEDAPVGAEYRLDMEIDSVEHELRRFLFFLLVYRFQDSIVLPAERVALVSLYSLLQKGQTLEFLSDPLKDFCDRLWRAEMAAKHEKPRPASVPSDLETSMSSIIGGRAEFTGADKALRFIGENAGTLPLHGSSTIVKSLAGLDVLLRRSQPPTGNFIVIDEPEMNAHPETQCQIVELLAMLVNRGNYVLFTTHSPYVLDHVNNLVEAGQVPPQRRSELAGNFKLKSEEAFLNSKDVSAYHFSPGGEVSDIFDREENVIDTSTFWESTSYLERTFHEVLQAQKDEASV
jgi:hypothetical protein